MDLSSGFCWWPARTTPHRFVAAVFLFSIALSGCTYVIPTSTDSTTPPHLHTPLSVSVSQDASGQLTLQWSGGQTATMYELYIDDTSSFRQPILHRSLSDSSVSMNPTDSGLATGVNYYVNVVAGNGQSAAQTSFRLSEQTWAEPEL